jgi:hypothetical protein
VYAPCGTPLAEVDGVWAYSNGEQTTSGYSCMGEAPNAAGALEFQCVEFAQRYMHEIYGIAMIWPVDMASQMCTSQPAGVTTHGSGYAPAKGDLAVWKDGSYGHVAVVAEVRPDAIRIVEQNASTAEGTRWLHGNPHDGFFSDWESTPSCYVHADAAPATPVPPAPTPDAPAPTETAQCDALGYDGECRGETSVWSDGGRCLVRDCAAEGRTCGWIADGVGWGCLGGTEGASTFDCADVGYTGVCAADDTLVWAQGGACHAVHCPDLGQRCDWADAIGYDCQ